MLGMIIVKIVSEISRYWLGLFARAIKTYSWGYVGTMGWNNHELGLEWFIWNMVIQLCLMAYHWKINDASYGDSMGHLFLGTSSEGEPVVFRGVWGSISSNLIFGCVWKSRIDAPNANFPWGISMAKPSRWIFGDGYFNPLINISRKNTFGNSSIYPSSQYVLTHDTIFGECTDPESQPLVWRPATSQGMKQIVPNGDRISVSLYA